jgi:hypothetical protein
MSLIAANGVDWTVAEWMNGRLEPLLDRAEIARLRAEGGVQQAQIAQLEAHAAHLEAYAAEVQAHAVALEDRVTALQAERSQTGERVAWLEDRHQTLCAVEAGGWWRLRSRVQPLLGPAARIWARIVGDRG